MKTPTAFPGRLLTRILDVIILDYECCRKVLKNLFPISHIKTRFRDLMSRQLIFAVIKRQQQAFRFSENDGNRIYQQERPNI